MKSDQIHYLAIATIFLMGPVGAALPLLFGVRNERVLLLGQLFAGGGTRPLHRSAIMC